MIEALKQALAGGVSVEDKTNKAREFLQILALTLFWMVTGINPLIPLF